MPRPSLKEKIVEAARSEFHRQGFTACSVDSITKAAGVPKGSFYNHFPSKEDLCAEVIRRYSSTSAWGEETAPGLPALGELRARFEKLARVTADGDFTRGCLMGNMGSEVADHSPVIRAQVDAGLEAWTGDIAGLLRTARERGELPAGADPERLARFILNAWQGCLLRAKVVKNSQPFEDFFTTVFDQLLG